MKKIGFRGQLLLVGALAAALMLTGCGAKKDAASASGGNEVQVTAAKGSASGGNELQSSNERNMFIVLRGLVLMDRQEDTVITKEEAQALLPLVQKVSQDGQLTEELQNQMFDQLTDAQKSFLTDMLNRVPAMRGGTAGGNGGNGPNRMKNLTNGAPENGGDTGPGTNNNGAAGQQRPGRGSWAGGGQNIEQQLIELLQSKL